MEGLVTPHQIVHLRFVDFFVYQFYLKQKEKELQMNIKYSY